MSRPRLALPFLAAVLLVAPCALPQGPVISEVMARNASGLRDADGELRDWIEIHNPGPATVSLTGWYLSDDPADLKKWRFPSRAIPAAGYEVVFFSGRDQRISGQPLHVPMQLDGRGAFLALVRADGTTIQSRLAPYPAQHPGVSYGRAGNTGAPVYFETPTPGAANGPGFAAVAAPVVASVPRGFLDTTTSVLLSSPTPAATIRYTTDGSAPTRTHGTVFGAPVPVAGSTVLRAAAFGPGHARGPVATWSYLFVADVLRQPKAPAGFPATWGTHKAPNGPFTAPGDYEMDPRVVNDPRYAPHLRDALLSLPTVSLVLDNDDMFGAARGIYSNPLEEGEAWERPVSVELLYPRMGRAQQVDAGIRLMGRGSRKPWLNPKHSMRLLFKESYGPRRLRADLFGPEAAREHDTLALRSIYNDAFTGVWIGVREAAIFVRDQFARDTQVAAGSVSPRGMFCHLFVNGLYWGLYNPTERPDADFQARYFGGAPEEYDVVKHFDGVVVDGDAQAFKAAMSLAQSGLGSPAAYAQLRGLVDVENLADYMLVQFFCGTLDWPPNNWYMARRRVPGAGFRFFVWDAEVSLLDVNADRTGVNAPNTPAYLYSQLRANAEFRLLFADRAHRLLFDGGALTTAACVARFRQRVEEVRLAVMATSARWGDAARSTPYTYAGDWVPDVDHELNTFFPGRSAVLLNQLRAAGLYPNVTAPVLSRHGGVIQPGFRLSMTAPQGVIHYTLDGSDPRLPGGAVAPQAARYAGAVTLQGSTAVSARVLQAGAWSALTAARFMVPGLVVNEVLARNESGVRDDFGEREDWIELLNPTARPLVASGKYLTDDRLAPTKWRVPPGITLQPGARLLVWADAEPAQGPLHAAFRLSADGEAVYLFDDDGRTLLDGFAFGPQAADVSIGALHEGRAPLAAFPEPTPGTSNEIACGRRLYTGLAQDLHPMLLEARGSMRLSSLIDLGLAGAAPGAPVMFFYARGTGYLEPLRPVSAVALLVGLPASRPVLLRADAFGRVALPVWIGSDPNLVGLRLSCQVFADTPAGIRGSNGVEIAICR